MKKKDLSILIDGFHRLSADAAEIADLLSGTETNAKKAEAEPATEPSQEPAPEADAPAPAPAVASEETQAKVYTFEEVRGILAEKARAGFREEVKALLTSHGVKQLSEISDPAVLATLVTESESFGNV